MNAVPLPHALRMQRAISLALAPLWLPALCLLLWAGLGYRIEGARELRARYRALRGAGGPLLVCPNHLTMIDSALVAWALGSPLFYLRHFAALPWNVPERRHFARSAWARASVYVLKCLPIERGGKRRAVGDTLRNAETLLARGETLLIFPEGRRSRSGRVESDAATWGVGRLLAAVPGTRVLCVYLRGRRQTALGTRPRRGERFDVAIECFEPKSEQQGMRRSLDLTRQILARLADLEARQGEAR